MSGAIVFESIAATFRVDGIRRRFCRRGQLPFVPVPGQRIDVGEGFYRCVSHVYYSTVDSTLIVWFQDKVEEFDGVPLQAPTNPRDDLEQFGWEVAS